MGCEWKRLWRHAWRWAALAVRSSRVRGSGVSGGPRGHVAWLTPEAAATATILPVPERCAHCEPIA